ncbi:MAG: glutamyl-tRNA reductase [archaeon]|nr:glutamyl-tRNA reductase [archaeon]
MIVSLHVTHTSAGSDKISGIIPVVEKGADEFIRSLRSVREYLILRTCNRFEIYVVTDEQNRMKTLLEEYTKKRVPYDGTNILWYMQEGMGSVRHLFRVICGLDSLIVGEDQIQSQVKNAYIKAKTEGHIGKILATVFEKALYTGKRVRTETELNSGAVSVGSAAVRMAEKKLGGLSGKTVAIIGAGDMGTVIAKYLKNKNLNAIFISNRTFEHAKLLADEVGGIATNFYNIIDTLIQSDLAIVATNAPHILIDKKMVEKIATKKTKKLLIVDISVPRNVADDIGQLENIEVNSMVDIDEVSKENLMNRYNEIILAERIVSNEIKEMELKIKSHKADKIIGYIAATSSRIRSEELDEAISRIKSGVDSIAVLNDFSHALVAKLFADLFDRLREETMNGNTEVCELASKLFGVENK